MDSTDLLKNEILIKNTKLTIYDLEKAIKFIKKCNTYTLKIINSILETYEKSKTFDTFFLSKLNTIKNISFSIIYSLYDVEFDSENRSIENLISNIKLKEDVDTLIREKSEGEENYQNTIATINEHIENIINSIIYYEENILKKISKDYANDPNYDEITLKDILERIENNIEDSGIKEIKYNINESLELINKIESSIINWSYYLRKENCSIESIRNDIITKIINLDSINREIYENNERVSNGYALYIIIPFSERNPENNNEFNENTFEYLLEELKNKTNTITNLLNTLTESIVNNIIGIIEILS